MIALLTGQVVALEAGACVIDVNGVGYLVHASTRTLSALPKPACPGARAGGDGGAGGRHSCCSASPTRPSATGSGC